MQAATMQNQQQQGGVYLGNGVPRVTQHQSTPLTSSSSGGGVKKWKNKLKTFLNSPLPGASSGSSQSSSSSSNTAPAALSSIASPSSSTTASITPRPDSPREKFVSSSTSRPTSPHPFATADHHTSTSTPKPSTTNNHAISSSTARSAFNSDVYAGYDISVNYPNNNDTEAESAGPNDSYEARLSRLVGDLENVDYGSFSNLMGGGADHSGDIMVGSGNSRSGNIDSAVNGDVDRSNDIRISSSLFKANDRSMQNDDIEIFSSNHPFAYASAGTPSHLESSNGPSSSFKPFSNSYLSSSNNFQNQFPISSSSNGIINIEDALSSFSTPFFTDFSAYTNLDDDLNGDIRIPPFESHTSSESEGQTPSSSSASAPLSAVNSASSYASGMSTPGTSEILSQLGTQHQRQKSQHGETTIPVPFSMPDIASLCAPPPVIRHSASMPFAPFQDMSIGAVDVPIPQGQVTNNTEDSDEDDDDFSSMLRQSQIEAGSGSSHATIGATASSEASLSTFQGNSMPSMSSLSTQATSSPLNVANFDLTMFPMPKSTGTTSVKMGSQPSSGSESSYGPSPSLSYGGSSTSNTSFDEANANKDNLPLTPKKSRGGKNGKSNPKNLSISLEEPDFDTSNVTISPGVKTPTHSPHPSISSVPATPSSYKTASSVPTSPYRPRPMIHASALAWRVAPSPHSPQSAIAVDTTRTLRPVASQSFISSDPFAVTTSPSRLCKLNTASSPELKRRRNTAEDEELSSPVGQGGIEARLANSNDEACATQIGNQMLLPMSDSPLRPIAYRRRVGHKFSTPQLGLQMPQRQEQQQQLMQMPMQTHNALSLHQRQYSQPLPVTTQVPLQYTMPASAGPTSTFQNSQQLHTRQYTSPLPSPSSAAYNYTQQQSGPLQQPETSSSWLSDNIITSLITQLSDQSYMCLMQNCSQRFGNMDDVKTHIAGHFAPHTVPLQHSQPQPVYQQQSQTCPQYPMYHQPTQYPQQSQQQTWT